MNINRRDFLRNLTIGGGVLSSGLFSIDSIYSAPKSDKIIVHVLLEGGPDWRHLIVPPYSDKSNSYESAYWSNRKNIHIGRFSRTADMKQRYSNDYSQLSGGNLGQFGILKKAGWLLDQYKKGNVAIINNVKHSINRNHSWSLIISQSGDMSAKESEADRDGWGGRLAQAMNSNILSLTPQVKLFCNPPKGKSRNNILSASDSRQFGLYEPDIFYGRKRPKGSKAEKYNSNRVKMHRALSSYYNMKSNVEKRELFTRFFEHESKMRAIGQSVRNRLDRFPDYYHGFPAHNNKNRDKNLQKFRYDQTFIDSGFGLQMRSLFDSIMAQDIIGFNIASMAMGGWDSHKLQQDTIEPKINQIFGNELLNNGGKPVSGKYGALRTLYDLLPDNKQRNIVFVFSGDFGRQLKANGAGGTDHGRGNTIFVVGDKVNGGVYGELFPKNEINRFRLDNQDNHGLTSLDQVYSRVCDWMGNYGDSVFPDRKSGVIEKPGLLDNLFKS